MPRARSWSGSSKQRSSLLTQHAGLLMFAAGDDLEGFNSTDSFDNGKEIQ
jgi:hypothetical protein